jgi:hypothetical protein
MAKPKAPRTLAALRADPRVAQVWNEGEDGRWCAMRGYRNAEGCHTLHETSDAALLSAFADALARGPCCCTECVRK